MPTASPGCAGASVPAGSPAEFSAPAGPGFSRLFPPTGFLRKWFDSEGWINRSASLGIISPTEALPCETVETKRLGLMVLSKRFGSGTYLNPDPGIWRSKPKRFGRKGQKNLVGFGMGKRFPFAGPAV